MAPPPPTTLNPWEWQRHGACRGTSAEVFYHPDGERGRAHALRERKAKAICRSCPVLESCREHALRTAEPYGIWGGMSESERTALLRRNRSGYSSRSTTRASQGRRISSAASSS
ncbi:WhiB family transcriptional regulator [Corynebacterium sp. zg-331]|uniref:WhiB family transcriptional regulator n=1 Tax=unclassified Corynebacterium TaxID=2624378 RepID=UPI00128B7B1F|nr:MULTISPECIES: WhiB family transcriptional regulator [unclassified Corynebacterium]MBC3185978.1 WhiB family transcriptional regulator [Corynebacterium sp. zg-331]MPV52469.1 WhiB family transcriptional regulator [Corynebacterium sp. zg331]